MKPILRLILLAALALALPTGCAPRYKVTFANQTVSSARGKPKHNKADGTVVFKDGKGNKQVVPAFTVQSVEPY